MNSAYVQEYSIADDGIVEMPRVTSGYTEGDFQRWLNANAITTHGIFSLISFIPMTPIQKIAAGA